MLGNLKMKVNEIFKGLSNEIKDRLNPNRQRSDDDEQEQRYRDYQARQQAIVDRYRSLGPKQTTAATSAATDISQTLASTPNRQYRFADPENPTIDVIIRSTGYYLTKLPQELQGQVKRDRATGLYPVQRPENIRKINQYYDRLADLGKVREEPVHAL